MDFTASQLFDQLAGTIDRRLRIMGIKSLLELEIFQRIEVRYDQTAGTLTIPTFRQDLLHRCDIAEEVARLIAASALWGSSPFSNLPEASVRRPTRLADLRMLAPLKDAASKSTVFTSLDGQERNLDADVLMICDAEKEVGIAGIMGGENSMITDAVHRRAYGM